MFSNTFKTLMSYEKFYYKHHSNPQFDKNTTTFVHYADEVPCGTNSFMSGILYCNQNTVPVTYSCDTAVLPSYQGNGIFTAIIKRAINVCEAGRPAVICAAPNDNSYHGFKKLGFTELVQLEAWSAILHPFRFGLKKFLRWELPCKPFCVEHFVDKYGNLWNTSKHCPLTDEEITFLNERPGIHLSRSQAFYQWKVENNQGLDFLYIKVTKEEKIVAFFLLKRNDSGTCQLCDWWVNADHDKLLNLLRQYCKKYTDILHIQTINPLSGINIFLSRSGFFRRAEYHQPFLLYNTGANPQLWNELNQAEKWQMYEIDFDTILN